MNTTIRRNEVESSRVNSSLAMTTLVLMVSLMLSTKAIAQGTWGTVAPLSIARASYGAATGPDGRIYVMGGIDNSSNFLSSVEVYDPVLNSWTSVSPMPTARAGLAVVTGPDGRIYAIGGAPPSGPTLGTVEAYDTSSDTWTTLAPMPTARAGLTAVTGRNGVIYAIGGGNTTPDLNTVEAYDPATNTWTTVAPMPTARRAPVVQTGPDCRIYVIGGLSDSQVPAHTEVEAYDPDSDTWTTVAPMPLLHGVSGGALGNDGRIYVIGGITGGSGTIVKTVEAYDAVTNSWATMASLATQRFSLAAATAPDGKIYAISGQVGFFPSATTSVEVYTPSSSQITVSGLLATPNPVAVGSAVTLTGQVSTAAGTVISAVTGVDCALSAMSATDGTFDEPSENVTVTLPPFSSAGVYQICARGTDSAGNVSAFECVFIPVYDPSAGFVTGGGWINSPSGAYQADLTMTGKANFGFVSKYKKGASIPTGNTEFQFKVGNLNFSSTAYDWLVIAGARAQYKGTGTINGGDNNGSGYGFMLTAIDGQVNGGGGVDKFRIKIWKKSDGTIVYDNQVGSGVDGSDASDPVTAVGGGSIVIHKN